MKTKALILGATPPFEGPTISLSESSLWEIEVTTLPVGVEVGDALDLYVMYPNGDSTLSPHKDLRIKNALSIRATIGEIEGVEIVSVSATEVEEC